MRKNLPVLVLALIMLAGCTGYDLQPTVTTFTKDEKGTVIAEKVSEDPRITAQRLQISAQQACYKAQEARYKKQKFDGLKPDQILLSKALDVLAAKDGDPCAQKGMNIFEADVRIAESKNKLLGSGLKTVTNGVVWGMGINALGDLAASANSGTNIQASDKATINIDDSLKNNGNNISGGNSWSPLSDSYNTDKGNDKSSTSTTNEGSFN